MRAVIGSHESLRQPVRGGKPWGGNSMFADQYTTISSAPVGRWSETLKPDEAITIELLAGSVMRHFDYQTSNNVATLDHPSRRVVIRRMLSLTRVSKSPQDRAIIQTASEILTHPSQAGIASSYANKDILPAWQLFIRLSWLWCKDLLRI